VRSDPDLRNISDTARWVAIYRAIESERSDALCHDQPGRRLAGERGRRIADTLEFAKSQRLVVRCALGSVRSPRHRDIANAADMIVNLAAGLDTRPYRMDCRPAAVDRSRFTADARLQDGGAVTGDAPLRPRARAARPGERRRASRTLQPPERERAR
jgi:hypothetical protein